jgi:hypothetical protein
MEFILAESAVVRPGEIRDQGERLGRRALRQIVDDLRAASDKGAVFAEAARLLRPGGRLALADIVSGPPLVGRTRRNTDVWAACTGGAIPQERYVEAIESVGLRAEDIRENPQYEFISERALGACDKYGVTSVSLVARR